MSGRGYSSLDPREKMVARYRSSGKEKFTLLIMSDFDPDGEEIAISFARSLRDDFGVKKIHAVKVALTQEQTQTYDLPKGNPAKKTSSNYEKFVRRYGEVTYELEALPADDLQEILTETIDSVIDLVAFNHELAKEKEDAAFITSVRKTSFAAFADMNLPSAQTAASKNGKTAKKKKRKK